MSEDGAVGRGGVWRVAGLVGGWAVAAVVCWGIAFGSGESCSAAVGAVEGSDGAELRPCELVGGITRVAVLACVLLVVQGLVAGAWRSTSRTLAILGAQAVLVGVVLLAIDGANLR
jgi:hypothetical protein